MSGERLSSVAQILGTLVPTLIGSGTTKTTQTANSQNLDNGTLASLQELVSGGKYSKGAAVTDAQSAMQNAMRILLQQGAPDIASAQHGAGLYNDTTSNLLSHDLQSRIAGEVGNLQLNNIKNYADIRSNAANTLKGATTNVTETTSQKTSPAIDPLTTIGVLAGGTLLNSLLSGSGGGLFDFGTKKKGGNNSLETPPAFSSGTSSEGNIGSVLSSLITPNFVSQGGLNASKGASASSNIGDVLSGIGSSASDLLGGLGTSLLHGLLGSSGNTSSPGATTGPSAGSAGDIGNQGSNVSGGGNSIGDFFKSLLGGFLGF